MLHVDLPYMHSCMAQVEAYTIFLLTTRANICRVNRAKSQVFIVLLGKSFFQDVGLCARTFKRICL